MFYFLCYFVEFTACVQLCVQSALIPHVSHLTLIPRAVCVCGALVPSVLISPRGVVIVCCLLPAALPVCPLLCLDY